MVSAVVAANFLLVPRRQAAVHTTRTIPPLGAYTSALIGPIATNSIPLDAEIHDLSSDVFST